MSLAFATAMNTNPPFTTIDRAVFAELEDLAGDDRAFLEDLITVYCDQAEVLFACAASDDLTVALRALHALNGSSRNVGATDVAERCVDIEREARSGVGNGRIAPMLAALRESLDVACAELHSILAVHGGP